MDSYNPLKFITEEISDKELIQIFYSGNIDSFCSAITLDIYTFNHTSPDKNLV